MHASRAGKHNIGGHRDTASTTAGHPSADICRLTSTTRIEQWGRGPSSPAGPVPEASDEHGHAVPNLASGRMQHGPSPTWPPPPPPGPFMHESACRARDEPATEAWRTTTANEEPREADVRALAATETHTPPHVENRREAAGRAANGPPRCPQPPRLRFRPVCSWSERSLQHPKPTVSRCLRTATWIRGPHALFRRSRFRIR
jgi:hypothetical protein